VQQPDENHQPPLFYALVLLGGYLTYLVLRPFLTPLIWAAVFAMLFYGLQTRYAPTIGRNKMAVAITLLTATLIVAPAVVLASVLAQEIPQAINEVQLATSEPHRLERFWDAIRTYSPIELPEDASELGREGMRRAVAFLAPHAGALMADIVAFIGSLIAMLFALFFMLRDGETFARHVRDLLPLPVRIRERLMSDTRDLVVASVGAGIIVALAQGVIGGVAFWLLGIQAPVFWGLVIAFASLLPIFGAALVWAPAAIWLALSGHIVQAFILVGVGVLAISMADNVLRPLLLAGRTAVSGFIVFFGLLGGMAAFGFVGLVLGPIVLVTTGSLLRVLTKGTTHGQIEV
jgi:predicted PurR-regulated permease PerM